MPNLRILNPTRSRQYSGRKGLGIRAFCKRANLVEGWGLGPQMVALRNIQGPQIVTNAIVGSHTESRAGYVSADDGLRDAGAIEFDANFVPEYASWQRFNDQFALSDPRVATSFMGGLFGVNGQDFNRSGMELEDVHAHQYDFYLALPNTLTLIHSFGFPSMLGPVIFAMESIIMSQFSFKISEAPELMRPIAITHYPDSIDNGAQVASSALGGATGQGANQGLPTEVPTLAFSADTSPAYGGMQFTYDAVNMALYTDRYYDGSAGHYALRLIYPGEYEIFSNIKEYDGTGGLVFGSLAAGMTRADWPAVAINEYRDHIEDFREVMGRAGTNRKGGWYAILYRCGWLDD